MTADPSRARIRSPQSVHAEGGGGEVLRRGYPPEPAARHVARRAGFSRWRAQEGGTGEELSQAHVGGAGRQGALPGEPRALARGGGGTVGRGGRAGDRSAGSDSGGGAGGAARGLSPLSGARARAGRAAVRGSWRGACVAAAARRAGGSRSRGHTRETSAPASCARPSRRSARRRARHRAALPARCLSRRGHTALPLAAAVGGICDERRAAAASSAVRAERRAAGQLRVLRARGQAGVRRPRGAGRLGLRAGEVAGLELGTSSGIAAGSACAAGALGGIACRCRRPRPGIRWRRAGAVSPDVAPGAGGRCGAGTAGPGGAGAGARTRGGGIGGERGGLRGGRSGWRSVTASGWRARAHRDRGGGGGGAAGCRIGGSPEGLARLRGGGARGLRRGAAAAAALDAAGGLPGRGRGGVWWERHIGGAARGAAAGRGGDGRDRVCPGGGVADPPGAGQGGRADRGREAGVGERDRRAPAPLRGSWRGRDGRSPGGKPASPYGQVDPAVVEAMRQAIAEAEQESSRTATYLFWRTGQILEAAHGPGRPGCRPSAVFTGCWTSCRRAAHHRVGPHPPVAG